MSTDQITTKLNIDLKSGYYLADRFTADTKLVIIERDSYMRLLAVLTPDQHAHLLDLAENDQFHGISGHVI